jgi:RNA polymerase sigma-70 factor (ECF subfamily)
MKTAETLHDFQFECLLNEEKTALKALAMQLSRNHDDALDLVQDTFLKALRYKDKFSEGSNLKAWLYTILKNSFINNYRRQVKRNTFIDTTDNTYYLDAPSNRIENQAELTFIRKDLEQAIEQLPTDLKVTFMLNIEGFKYQEIADELNIPIGKVKTRIFVARKILRKSLKAYAGEFKQSKSVNE